MDEMKEDQGVTDDHIIYMNLEDMKYAFIKNAMDLYGYVEKLIVDEEKYYIFLDEIQMVEEFERAINSFHATKNVSIFITGSNSWLLSGELATLLSGRYVSFRVMPFLFQTLLLSLLPTSHTFPENETASPENSRIFRITMLLILPTTASYWNTLY